MGIIYIVGGSRKSGATGITHGLKNVWEGIGLDVAVYDLLQLGSPEQQAISAKSIPSKPTAKPTRLHTNQIQASIGQIQELSKHHDLLLVDGLRLPQTRAEGVSTYSQIAEKVQGKVIGIQKYIHQGVGRVTARWQTAFGSNLLGLIINQRTRYAGFDARTRLKGYLEKEGIELFGIIPEDRLLLAPTVSQIAAHIGACFFTWPSKGDLLIEKFMIGGLILEWGGNYFGRFPNQGVIVRGGRVDIAMSALNFPMSCLILTGVSEPPQYVYQRADEQGVPLLVVNEDTLSVTTKLSLFNEPPPSYDESKRLRFVDLLESNIDMPRISHLMKLNA